MNRTIAVLSLSLIAVLVLVGVLLTPPAPNQHGGALTPSVAVFCAASNRAVMEAVKNDYEQETGENALYIGYPVISVPPGLDADQKPVWPLERLAPGQLKRSHPHQPGA